MPYVEKEREHDDADWKKAIAGLENEPEKEVTHAVRCVSSIGCIMQPAMPQANGPSGLTTTLVLPPALEEHPTDRYSGNGGSERLVPTWNGGVRTGEKVVYN